MQAWQQGKGGGMCSSPAASSDLGAGFGKPPGSTGNARGGGSGGELPKGWEPAGTEEGGGEAGRMRWERREAENRKYSQGQRFLPKQHRELGLFGCLPGASLLMG